MTILLHDPATEEPGGEAVFVLPASYAQQRLWFLDQLEPGSPLYNIPLALRLTGPLDAGALAEALGGIVRRHEALRTTLAVEDGQVVQVVASPGSWQLPRIGLESFAPAERRAAARRLAAEEAVRPFDLARGPLFRAVLLDLGVLDGSAEHLLCLNLHHAIADGWSLGIFQRELAALYRARRAAPGGQTGPAPLAELPIQYGDYAAWQREELQGSALEGHLAWWRERLGDAPRLMELPLARPRPAARDHRGEQRSLALPPELAGRLKAICQREGVTRFMILLAAFAALLHRTTGQTDLVIGTPLAGREQLDTEGVIGLFANVVALRIGLGGGELTFRGLLSRVRESFLGAHAHQDLPFERLVEELQPERSLSHPPLVQVLFTFHESSPLAAPSLPGLRVEPVELHTGTVKLDLGLSCEERGTALLARLDYAADLLDGVDALRLLLSLGALLGGVAADPGRRLAELPVTTEEGLHQLLAEWNDTAAPFRRELCLHERFAAQAARTPRAVAVGWGEERISYAALARRASRLARRLRRLGVGPESRVGVALERTPRLVAALLAVLEAGGAYVPLDPAYPRERLAFILADAQEGQARPVLLTERPVLERLPAFAGAVVCLDEADDEEEDGDKEDEERAPAGGAVAGNLAYLIYTSGSTGRPKGVAIEHRSAAALLDWAAGVFPLPPAGDLSRVLAATSITFDLSVFELFLPLTTGGTVVLAEDALALPRLPMAGEVRLVNTVPSALAALVRTGGLPAAVRTVNLAGEPLKRALVDEIHALPGVARVFNLYGPSEDTTYSTWALVPRGDRREPTIGMPIANTRAYVVDPWLGPLPAGVAGELCLGGEGLARGYLNRPELTAEKFVPDPFGGSLAGAAGGRLYRTGDLARRRADGELEFLGRIDHQVKVRGFRIELGEIEAALCAHPQVREAVVLAREDTPGDPRLVAYVEPVGSGMLPADLRARLAERLPGYMIPAAFVALAALPRTPNGKVDRKALPAPEWRGEDAQPVAPRTPTEELLTGIWGAVLRRPAVGVREDFFALGGHSLLATQVVSRVREVCGVEVPLRRLFAAPTVEGLAAAVEEARRQRQAGTAGPVPPVVPVPRDGDPAASFAQERLWFLDRMGEGGTAYNLPVALCLRGGLDPLKVTALAAALSEVARRHEALRTTFRAYGSGRPGVAQVIAPPGPVPLPVVDLRRLPDAAAAGRRLAAAVAGRRFDLERGPLLRALLLRLADEDHTLVLAMHHIVSDGWSMGVLVREVAALYDAFAAGRPSPLPELAVQYADFAAWQRERLQGEALAAQLAFWRAALAGLPPVLDLPTDRPRPAVRGGRSGRLAFRVPAGAAVQGCARGAGATLFMALLAAFQTLLARWSGSDDVAVGSPIANRNRAETEPLIGFFVNTLVLRGGLGGSPSFGALLRRVRETLLDAYAHQDLPFEKVVEELRPERALSHSPLFQVMLILQNAPLALPRLAGLGLAVEEIAGETAKLDLTLSLAEDEGGLRGQLEYDRDLFDGTTAERLLGHYLTLLAAAVAAPERRAAELELLPAAERAQLLGEWNDTAAPFRRDLCLHERFAAQAARTPRAVALVWGEERISYADLARRANRLAHRLRRLGVGPESRVGVALERTPELVAALLAVLAAGGAYVPLDPAYPRQRLAFLLADAQEGQGSPVLLTERRVLDRLPAFTGAILVLDELDLSAESERAPESGASAENLAYLIYTSGSTGRPKGVGIAHRSAAALLDWASGVFPAAELAGVLAATSVTFDLSVFELFLPLTTGGTVVLADDALALPHLPAAGEVTLINTVPSAMAALVRSGGVPAGVRTVNLAGEALPRALVEEIYALPGVEKVFNLYGPSEDTTYSTWVLVPRGEAREPTIGSPVANSQAHVVDRALGLLPVGVPGELCLGGEGLARGYLNRPELTAERFVPDPFGADGGRLYRAGDLARRRAGGELEFLGRIDHQVKVRGFRIELGEVEAALLAHPEVAEAVVVAREEAGGKRLVAYVAPAVPGDLRERLRERLPDYMVPSAFVGLPELPRTPNGKVDRQALPAPEQDGGTAGPAALRAPMGPIEELVAGIWCAVLRRDRVGPRDDFFALGGHSLLATLVVSRLREVCGVEIPLRRLFEAPTVAGLAVHVEAARASSALLPAPAIVPVPRTGDLPASFSQERLWLLEQLGDASAAYHVPLALRLRGGLDPLEIAALAAALSEVVRRHEALRTTFRADGARVLQVVAPPHPVPLPVVDLRGLPSTSEITPETTARRLAAGAARRRFDLARGPLLRALLLRLTDTEHDLVLCLHHIVSDGWSLGVLLREVAALYAAFTAGRPSPLPALAVQYADFAAWQRAWLQGEVLAAHLAWWREHLAGLPPVLDLPTDRPRPARGNARAGRVPFRLDERSVASFQDLVRRSAVTPFMALLAAFAALLARWSGSADVAVGSPIANRNRAETEPLIGFFVNTLVLRADLGRDPSFAALVGTLREVTLGAYAHQDLPFEKLVEELRPERALAHSPLFQVMLVLQNAAVAPPRLGDLEMSAREIAGEGAKFDLTLAVAIDGTELRGELEYDRELFDRATAERLLGHYLTLLAAAVAAPERPALELPLLSPGERAQLLGEWNDTAMPFAAEACLHERFAAQAARTPAAVAVVWGQQRLPYGDLERRANRLARRLRRLGVGPESRVGVALERTPELVVALLAVLKAGGAYVPLDPAYPRERLAFLLADAQEGQASPVLLSEARVLERLPAFAGSVLCLDEVDAAGAAEEGERPPESGAVAGNLAYLIYTSGSTGRPKGVAITHRSAAALLDWAAGVFTAGELSGVLAATSITFDLSVFELFLPLTTGGTVVLADDALALPHLPAAGEVRLINTVPSAMAALVRSGGVPAGVRTVNLAGEALQRSLVEEIYSLPGIEKVFNLYGPSEDTTYSTWVLVPRGEAREPAIGSPVGNSQAHVADRGLGLLPAGVPGELCLGGEGLARGYLNRPELTAERFVPDPFAAAPGRRLYRTGDLARRRAGGELEFLGRLDHQVKVRGFRIELGEVEAAVGAHPEVREAVVLARQEGAGLQPGERRLVAYVAPALPADLPERLRERLPAHMIPAAFVPLPALPRTPNGKVDRQALPAPEWGQWGNGAAAEAAPASPLEELLAGIFGEVLRLPRVGVKDDFFALGGHSLLATQVVSRLREVCGVEVPLRRLFEAPTVAALAARVEAARADPSLAPAPPLVPAPRLADPPASFAQERLWFLERLGIGSGGGASYLIPDELRLCGRLDVAALARALGEVVRRHEALRTAFAMAGDRVVQVIAPALHLPLPVVDLTALPAPACEVAAAALAWQEARRAFDLLARLPLLRATLLRRAATDHALLLTFHHIVFDGWSTGVLIREIAALYAAFLVGSPSPLPALPVQYADFAAWQRAWLQGEVLAAQLAWWRERLAGAPAVLELPTDRPRPAVLSTRGARRTHRLPAPLAAGLAALSRRAGATPFMAVLAAFQAVLARSTGVYDVPVGSPIAGRTRRETEGLIGLFVNTLVLRHDFRDLGRGDPGFAALLERAREATLDAYAHQDLPFEKLVEELQPRRDTSHTPLFQVMLIVQNTPRLELELPGLQVSGREVDAGTAKFDLTLVFAEVGGGLTAALEYNRDLFDATTAARLLVAIESLLAGAVADPQRRLAELPLLPAGARHQVLREWNDTGAGFPRGLCLHQPFEEQAARSPEAPALLCGGERMTYGELNRRANRLAHRLRELGMGPGGLAGVHLDRGFAMVVAVLAVHKAGGAYVPLETSWPEERVAWILERHGIAHLLTGTAQLAGAVPALPGLRHVVCVDRPEELAALPESDPPAAAGPGDLAYIIFTSGSTGRPKGVMVRHRPAVNLIHWVNQRFAVGPADRLLFVTALSFDLSVYDLFGTLAAGGAVRIASALEAKDPEALVGILCREGITFWDSAPAALQNIAPLFPAAAAAGTPALRLVFLSGDWIPLSLPDRVREAFPGARVVSLGGATEATIWSNFHPVERVDPRWASIPYGRPIDNARYHVLGPGLDPCPLGVAGDLYIGGECLSDGYADAPELTAERYLPDPFSGEPGARLYATGDRARYWPDGELEFLGRVDTQVKVRGFRIELGEIESVLCAHPAVREAVVLCREDTPGDRRLVAYVIPAAEPGPPAAELRRFAQVKLPEYMVPSAFVLRASWPLSATGKLDRKALPPPERRGAAAEGSFEPPRDELERTLAAIWCEAIGRERVSVQQSFFEAGGHSLLLARVHARLEAVLGRRLPMVRLFQHPTIRSLAQALRAEVPAAAGLAPAAAPDRAGARPRPAEGLGLAIAVVAVAGRFPGARTAEELWRNVRDGVESIRFFTDAELLAAGIPQAVLAEPGLVKARGALDDPDLFDAAFFDYPPREAQIMDPQQRLFLECAWEALERAGYGSDARRGRVAVYAGATENTYVHNLFANPDLVRSVGRQQIAIANNHDYLPTRVSYKLNLRGPSVNVQTACSTSLVAVHLACQSLRHGDCDLALAGGASVQAREVAPYFYHEGGIASPDGHTRAFDARAQGVVGGSGVGAVVLKRLEDAVADGDTVLAVIRGSASNNDGTAKVGFTAPSVEGQAAALRAALASAGVDAASIQYVEAHGTGTALGDPIEVAALNAAFAASPDGDGGEQPPCAIGSVKTNIGHLDAASGAAGLIKTVLALREGILPPSLHFERPNPRIDFGPFFVNTRATPWPADSDPRRAGVSSFGIGGTNAHVILEEAPAMPPGDLPRRPAHLLVLSAKTPAALDAATAALAGHLAACPELDAEGTARLLADTAFTLQVGRQPFRHRRMLVCRGAAEAAEALRAVDPARVVTSDPDAAAASVAFLFPGQGAQHAGMAAELYRAEPVFRAALDRCCDLFLPELGRDLREVLFPAAERAAAAAAELAQTALTQPALFAVEHALAQLWMDWGVRPAALLGHSIGEYVAACLAGVFPLADAVRLVAARGRLMGEMPPGGMLAVSLPEEEVVAFLSETAPGLALAAVNGPRACVVAGPPDAVAALRSTLAERGVETRRLRTSHAFHSPMMDPVLEPFAELVAQAALAPPRIPFLSNVTGAWITAEMATDPAYWARHLRSTVRFADGLGELLRQPRPALLEVGPGRALSTLARQHPERGAARLVVPSLGRAQQSELEQVLAALGRLWLAGVEVDWDAFHAGERRRRVPLPTYPFERRRYWIDGIAAQPKPAADTAALAAEPAAEETVPATRASAAGPADPLQTVIAGVWRDLLGVERVNAHDDFFDLGGSSLMAVQLGSRLRQALGVALPSDFLLQASTLAALAALVAAVQGGAGAAAGAPERSSLVRLQAGSPARRPLFLVHQVGGHVFTFRNLARELGGEQPLYGLRSRGLEGEEEPLDRVEAMAAHYLELVRRAQPAGPYRIGGASMGGMVAFEMAHQLLAAGETVELLTLMDTPCGDQMPPRPAADGEIVAAVFAGRAAFTREELASPCAEELLVRAVAKAKASDRSNPNGGLELDEARRLFRVLKGNIAALFDYVPRPYPGRMLFFRAQERRPIDPPRPELPWIELARGGIEIRLVPGDHETMHAPPHVRPVAECLRGLLR